MRNLVLTGFMGTGKTSVGRLVAERLGRPFVDMDALVEVRAGKPITRIFAEEGEPHFRAIEAALCRELSERSGLVIATGGGALIDPENRAVMAERGILVCLRADAEAVLSRVGSSTDRPLLQSADPQAAIARLLASREEAYAAIPWQVNTTGRSLEEIAEAVAGLTDVQTLRVPHHEGAYEIHIGSGVLAYLGAILRATGVTPGARVVVVTNTVVEPLYAEQVETALRSAELRTTRVVIPDGEAHKILATVEQLYDAFLAADLDRSGLVVALGGGVTGDIAGFAAATYMRGVRLVQVPTTLLAMTDSSVGGKTGVDLPQGKNLVGAFKHPELVFIDVRVLDTLPAVEYRSGLAEVIKHGVVGDPVLFDALGRRLRDGDVPVTPELLARSILTKVGVVSEDPHEMGRRAVLNLGHTTAHALERLSRYTLRHGEAVSIGMVAASKLAVALEIADHDVSAAIENVLNVAGLPVRCPALPVASILGAMRHDKKRRGAGLRWILPQAIGAVGIYDDVPQRAVASVLAQMGAIADDR